MPSGYGATTITAIATRAEVSAPTVYAAFGTKAEVLKRVIDVALAGGVSEAIHTFGIFASFKAEGALAQHEEPARASRPFDRRIGNLDRRQPP